MTLGKTLGEARQILSGLPDDTPTHVFDLEDAEFVIIVDSRGNAQRIISKTTRVLMISVHIPVRS
jgi:hypothetical protein